MIDYLGQIAGQMIEDNPAKFMVLLMFLLIGLNILFMMLTQKISKWRKR